MNNVIKMLLTLSIIGIVSGAALSEISDWAAPKIEAHRKAETERAIYLVQKSAARQERVDGIDFELYRVFDNGGNEIGYAMPWEGNGFQGKVRIMFGVTKDMERVTGLEVLEQVETPGLGTKITEDPFKDQFKGLLSVPEVKWVKGTKPSNPNEVQTITGATISSKAIVGILNSGLGRLRQTMRQGGEL